MPETNPWDFSEFTQDPNPDRPRQEQGRGDAAPRQGAPAPDRSPDALSSGGHEDLFGEAGGFGDSPMASTSSGQADSPWNFGATEVTAAAPLTIARPPINWLGIAAIVTVIGGVLALTLGSLPPVAIAAWLLCGPIAIGLLALFTSRDTVQRSRPTYAAPTWIKPAYVACLVLCGIAVIISAIRIALWVGRL